MRNNIYKDKILSILKQKHLLTIAELHKMLPDADYSTIFRNVEQLLTDKHIKKVMVDQKSTFYELTDNGHDHFICTDCGTVEAIHLSLNKTSLKNKKVSDVTVRGVCDSCEK